MAAALCCVTVIEVVTRWLKAFLTSPRVLKWKKGAHLVRTRWQQLISRLHPPPLTAGLLTDLLTRCPSPSATPAKCRLESARKDCSSAATAVKPLTGRRRWRSTSAFTPGRNLSAAPHAGRCSQRPETSENTRESTRGRNRTAVGCVAGVLPGYET